MSSQQGAQTLLTAEGGKLRDVVRKRYFGRFWSAGDQLYNHAFLEEKKNKQKGKGQSFVKIDINQLKIKQQHAYLQ